MSKRVASPESRIRERKGFVTAAVVPDCFKQKNIIAADNMHGFNQQTKKRELLSQEYVPPKDHKFRDEKEIERGMQDFLLRSKLPLMENPHGLSAFAEKPKYQQVEERRIQEKEEIARGLAAAGKPHEWRQYHKLPHKKTDMSLSFPDRFNKVNGP